MALIAHQTQGSFSTCSLRCKSSTSSSKWRSSVALQSICRTNEFRLVKHHPRSRCLPVSCPKRKAFRVLYFKGDAQNDAAEGRNNDSEFSKSPVNVSCKEPGREELLSESYDAQKNSLSYGSEDNKEIAAKSLAIKELFRKWLVILRTQTSTQIIDENIEESSGNTSSESQLEPTAVKARNRLKEAIVYFFRLDAAISIPLLIFIPGYLGVQVRYGAEVTKELMPLWILGPLIISLYVKIVQGLCSVYLFLFTQAIKLVKNLPAYSLLVYNYVTEGKLKAFLFAYFWKPIVDIKNLDYKAWVIEKYLDFVESIWPIYCRTIRFLKKAHLI